MNLLSITEMLSYSKFTGHQHSTQTNQFLPKQVRGKQGAVTIKMRPGRGQDSGCNGYLIGIAWDLWTLSRDAGKALHLQELGWG